MSEDTFSECFILVPDLDIATQFYEQALGLEAVTTSDHSIVYDNSGATFKVQEDYPPEVFEAFNLDQPPELERGIGAFFAIELLEPVESVYQRVVESEGEALFEPRIVEWLDGPMFLAKDPFGYTLEVRQR